MKRLPDDPVIREIREVRHRISAQFGHDPSKLVAHLMELEKKRFATAPQALESRSRIGRRAPTP